jgi:hypothetical protein
MFCIRSLGIRQRGHGQPPRFRTVAISTLVKYESALYNAQHLFIHVLLRIICRVSENPRVESAHDAVTAMNHNSMLVRLLELIVQQDLPLFVK